MNDTGSLWYIIKKSLETFNKFSNISKNYEKWRQFISKLTYLSIKHFN